MLSSTHTRHGYFLNLIASYLMLLHQQIYTSSVSFSLSKATSSKILFGKARIVLDWTWLEGCALCSSSHHGWYRSPIPAQPIANIFQMADSVGKALQRMKVARTTQSRCTESAKKKSFTLPHLGNVLRMTQEQIRFSNLGKGTCDALRFMLEFELA